MSIRGPENAHQIDSELGIGAPIHPPPNGAPFHRNPRFDPIPPHKKSMGHKKSKHRPNHRPNLKKGFVKLSILLCGVFVFQSILLEYLYSDNQVKKYSWSVSLIEVSTFSFLSYLATKRNKAKTPAIKRTYNLTHLEKFQLCLLSVSLLLAQGLAIRSLVYANFTTLVVFKSCKLVPVLIGRMIIINEFPSLSQILSVALCVIGLLLFSLADVTSSAQFQPTGILLLLFSIFFDALIPNLQEKFVKPPFSMEKYELLFRTNSIGALCLLTCLLLSGKHYTYDAFFFFLSHPMAIVLSISIGGITFYGVGIILTMTRNYDSLLTQTVTSARKGVTLILSFLIFPKPFHIFHLFGTSLVFGGVLVNIFGRGSSQIKNRNLLFLGKLSKQFSSIPFPRRMGISFAFGLITLLFIIGMTWNTAISTQESDLKKALSLAPSITSDITFTAILFGTENQLSKLRSFGNSLHSSGQPPDQIVFSIISNQSDQSQLSFSLKENEDMVLYPPDKVLLIPESLRYPPSNHFIITIPLHTVEISSTDWISEMIQWAKILPSAIFGFGGFSHSLSSSISYDGFKGAETNKFSPIPVSIIDLRKPTIFLSSLSTTLFSSTILSDCWSLSLQSIVQSPSTLQFLLPTGRYSSQPWVTHKLPIFPPHCMSES